MHSRITFGTSNLFVAGPAVALVLLSGICANAFAQMPLMPENLQPVSVAKDGYTQEESYRYRQMFSSDAVFNTREGFRIADENVYYNQHWEDVHPVNVVRRGGEVWELPFEPNDQVGKVSVELPMIGLTTLDDMIANDVSRVQGFVVVQNGKIIYETYPGMDENDNHIWYSTGKTLPAMVLTILEQQGKLDANDPIEMYMDELKGTNWEGIRIIDIMDMASGLDLAETMNTMMVEDHKVNKYFRISIGWDEIERDGVESEPWTIPELLNAIDGKEDVPPGTVFEYSSLNTHMLTRLAERVSGKRFPELLSEYIWSNIGAEGDALLGVNPSGGSIPGGMMNTRLRDLARYGLLFTPSWEAKYGADVREKWKLDPEVSLADIVFEGCRPELMTATMEIREAAAQEGEEDEFFVGPRDPEIQCNSRQWDLVWSDGDFYKGGVGGQGVYVSPKRNFVAAWYSTTLMGAGTRYAREIAKAIAPLD